MALREFRMGWRGGDGMGWWVYLLGASMRMGAEMPRYSREKLGESECVLSGGLGRGGRGGMCTLHS